MAPYTGFVGYVGDTIHQYYFLSAPVNFYHNPMLP